MKGGKGVTFAAGVELQPRTIVVRLVIDIAEDADARLPHGWNLNGVSADFQFQRRIDTRTDRAIAAIHSEWIARDNYCRANRYASLRRRRVLRNSAARSYAAKILSMFRCDDVTWHTRD